MVKRRLVLSAAVVAVAAAGYAFVRDAPPAPILGVVRSTEVHLEPEVAGQLAVIHVDVGTAVRAGDVLAELSAAELTAAQAQARAALASAEAARDRVYAGVRPEEVAGLSEEIAKAKSRLNLLEVQRGRTSTLTGDQVASRQELDQVDSATDAARSSLVEAEANYAAAVAGPTKEERAIADAQVAAAAAALTVIDRRLDKTILRAPADGMVTVVVGEIGENIRAGEPVLAIAAAGKEWLSFNIREDRIGNLAVGETVEVVRAGAGMGATLSAGVTELRGLGDFAVWQAERATDDHDRNTLRLRLDPDGPAGLQPGMTVWLPR